MALQICVEGVGVIEGAEICTLENMSVPYRPLECRLLHSKVLHFRNSSPNSLPNSESISLRLESVGDMFCYIIKNTILSPLEEDIFRRRCILKQTVQQVCTLLC